MFRPVLAYAHGFMLLAWIHRRAHMEGFARISLFKGPFSVAASRSLA
jgi:hypothetical protein